MGYPPSPQPPAHVPAFLCPHGVVTSPTSSTTCPEPPGHGAPGAGSVPGAAVGPGWLAGAGWDRDAPAPQEPLAARQTVLMKC